MQLTLTDREAQLLEQRLRGRTVSFSDSDHLVIQSIADRLLVREVGSVVPGPYFDNVLLADGTLLPRMTFDKPHCTRREGDEYACSCGARWDVSEGDDHPTR